MTRFYLTAAAALTVLSSFGQTPLPQFALGQTTAGKMQPMRMAPAKAADDKPYFITEVPESAQSAYYVRDWKGFWVFNYIFSAIMQGQESGRVQQLWTAGDDVWMQTPVLSFEAPTFLKGTVQPDGSLEFPLPQCIYSYTENQDGDLVRTDYYVDYLYFDTDFYSYFTSDTAQVHSWVLTPTPEGGYTWVNDEIITALDPEGVEQRYMKRIIGVVNQDEQWTGYADFLTELAPFTDKVTELPAGARTTLGTLTPAEGTPWQITMGFTDDQVFVKGISQQYPDVWAAGTINADGQVVFQPQYMAIYEGYYGYLTGATSEVKWSDLYEDYVRYITPLENAVFDYNPGARLLTATTDLYIGGGSELDTELVFIPNPVIQGKADTTKPAKPEILSWYNYNRDYGYGRISFDLFPFSTSGMELNTADMAWRLLLDGEPYVFDPSVHKRFEEPMEWIPFDFTDGDDIRITGNNRYVYFRSPFLYNIQVEVRYTADGTESYNSAIEYTTDSVNGIGTDVQVIYTDLLGRPVENPTHGVYLRTTVKADGSAKTVKVML